MPNPRVCPHTKLPLEGLDAIKAIRDGVQAEIAYELTCQDLIPPEQIYTLVCSKRTLARRVSRGERLSSFESERLLRLLRVLRYAADSFGDDAKAWSYLGRPMRRFDGYSCVQMLDTDLGTALVEELLARIDHGIPG
ncbi:DUF2384 domain-containing protein [Ectothiorhodospiraceae bacterium WFHF3C12]|nr:DUF2384 domain-containing protein [Ectothiorhodospiraceae bacterium WFHF3C12]